MKPIAWVYEFNDPDPQFDISFDPVRPEQWMASRCYPLYAPQSIKLNDIDIDDIIRHPLKYADTRESLARMVAEAAVSAINRKLLEEL